MVQEDALESASPRPLARLDESAESALAEMIEQQVPSAKPVLPLAKRLAGGQEGSQSYDSTMTAFEAEYGVSY
jgi:hypothetical protein